MMVLLLIRGRRRELENTIKGNRKKRRRRIRAGARILVALTNNKINDLSFAFFCATYVQLVVLDQAMLSFFSSLLFLLPPRTTHVQDKEKKVRTKVGAEASDDGHT